MRTSSLLARPHPPTHLQQPAVHAAALPQESQDLIPAASADPLPLACNNCAGLEGLTLDDILFLYGAAPVMPSC